MGVPLLVNYELPRTKEAYARRVRVALGGGGGGGLSSASSRQVSTAQQIGDSGGGDASPSSMICGRQLGATRSVSGEGGGDGGAVARVVVNVVAAAEAGTLRAMEAVCSSSGGGGSGGGGGGGFALDGGSSGSITLDGGRQPSLSQPISGSGGGVIEEMPINLLESLVRTLNSRAAAR